MKEFVKKHSLMLALLIGILNWAAFSLGIFLLNQKEFSLVPFLAHIGLSVLIAAVSYLFFRLRWHGASAAWLTGWLWGVVLMLISFGGSADGWGDLAGIASYIFCLLIGLAAGLVLQFIFAIVQYVHKKKNKSAQ